MQTFAPLRSSSRFSSVYRSGVRSRVGGILVLEAPTPGAEPGDAPTVGVVAGRKVGNAVHRNRAKRRMREAARRVLLNPGFDHVLVASREINTATFPQIVQWIDHALEKNRMKRSQVHQ